MGWAKKWFPGLVTFVPAVCLSFSEPGYHFSAQPCVIYFPALSLSSDELDADEAEGEEAGLLLGGVDERGDDGRRPLPQDVLLLLGHVLLYVLLQSGFTC